MWVVGYPMEEEGHVDVDLEEDAKEIAQFSGMYHEKLYTIS